MSRSKWKGFFVTKNVLKNKHLKFWNRDCSVVESMIGSSVFVHNGKEFKKVLITREKLGFKLGDFSYTRKHTPKLKVLKITQVKKKKT